MFHNIPSTPRKRCGRGPKADRGGKLEVQKPECLRIDGMPIFVAPEGRANREPWSIATAPKSFWGRIRPNTL